MKHQSRLFNRISTVLYGDIRLQNITVETPTSYDDLLVPNTSMQLLSKHHIVNKQAIQCLVDRTSLCLYIHEQYAVLNISYVILL